MELAELEVAGAAPARRHHDPIAALRALAGRALAGDQRGEADEDREAAEGEVEGGGIHLRPMVPGPAGGHEGGDPEIAPEVQRHASMSVRAMASRGGSTVSASSARVNQRTSSSSASRTCGSPPACSAKNPSMSELGNGHGCDA